MDFKSVHFKSRILLFFSLESRKNQYDKVDFYRFDQKYEAIWQRHFYCVKNN